jgi:putative intracellular protease/amidase
MQCNAMQWINRQILEYFSPFLPNPFLQTMTNSADKVLVLIEEHYDETEYNTFNEFFPKKNIKIDYASYLWGNESITFEGNDKTSKVEVSLCVSKVNLSDYKGLILIGGYAMDRLRYQASIGADRNQAPAVKLLREAVDLMDKEKLAIGTICHSLWLFCADPTLLKGRSVTCAHNIICDVENAGAHIVTSGDQNVDTHKDGFLITGKHPGVVDTFNDLFVDCLAAIK